MIANVCGAMGRLPAEVRAMTPEETQLLIRGWNAAQSAASGKVTPMTIDELEALERLYPDV